MWEAEEGIFEQFEATELDEWTPKTPASTDFSWDATCWVPDISCSEFRDEEIGVPGLKRVSVVDTSQSTDESNAGACW